MHDMSMQLRYLTSTLLYWSPCIRPRDQLWLPGSGVQWCHDSTLYDTNEAGRRLIARAVELGRTDKCMIKLHTYSNVHVCTVGGLVIMCRVFSRLVQERDTAVPQHGSLGIWKLYR